MRDTSAVMPAWITKVGVTRDARSSGSMRGKMRPYVIRPEHDSQHTLPKGKVQKTHGEEPRADPHEPEAAGIRLYSYLLHLLVHTLLQSRKIREKADTPPRLESRHKPPKPRDNRAQEYGEHPHTQAYAERPKGRRILGGWPVRGVREGACSNSLLRQRAM